MIRDRIMTALFGVDSKWNDVAEAVLPEVMERTSITSTTIERSMVITFMEAAHGVTMEICLIPMPT